MFSLILIIYLWKQSLQNWSRQTSKQKSNWASKHIEHLCNQYSISWMESPLSPLWEEGGEEEPELLADDRLKSVEERDLFEVKLLLIAAVLEAKNCKERTNIAGTIWNRKDKNIAISQNRSTCVIPILLSSNSLIIICLMRVIIFRNLPKLGRKYKEEEEYRQVINLLWSIV